MIETWFISDTHFGHKNILEYEKEARPFNTVEEMNEKLICNWNETVGIKDIVYHLGDFAFGKRNLDIAARLNGRKRLVMGNHDTYPSILYLAHFEKLFGYFFYDRCILSHAPVHPNQLGGRRFLNVHGHLHSRQVMMSYAQLRTEDGIILIPGEVDKNYFNVSCEQNKLTPIHRDVIMERIKELD